MRIEDIDPRQPLLPQIDQLPDEYHRLAYFISRYLASGVDEKEPLVYEFERLGLNITYPDNIVERLRTYCEWHCSTFPIDLVTGSEKLLAIIQFQYNTEFDDVSAINLLRAIGFKQPFPTKKGVKAVLSNLKSTYDKLYENEKNEIPHLNQEEATGLVQGTFNQVEELLEHIIVYYASWLTAKIIGADHSIEVLLKAATNLSLGKHEQRSLEKWVIGPSDGGWAKLIFNRSVGIIRSLNEIISEGESLSLDFQAIFKRCDIISNEELTKIEQVFNECRHKYAHSRTDDSANSANCTKTPSQIVYELMAFVNYLIRDRIIPDIVTIRRRMTLADGGVRLDYMQEDDQALKTFRPSRFIRFYKYKTRYVPCFFPLPAITEIDKDNTAKESDYLILIVPVDFRLKGIELT